MIRLSALFSKMIVGYLAHYTIKTIYILCEREVDNGSSV
jgi:hypothetical protein